MLAVHVSTPPDTYTGRSGEPGAYFFQRIHCLTAGVPLPSLSADELGIALIGYAVDEGVRRNLGRTGAADGPMALRVRLGKEPWHLPDAVKVFDLGDVRCPAGDLDQAQEVLSTLVARAQAAGYRTLVLGGGHDVASAHFRGLRRPSAGIANEAEIGVVNFDAHLDLRPIIADALTSGTPFTAIAQDAHAANRPFRYCCFGVQAQGNTRQLFQHAEELGAVLIPLEKATPSSEALVGFRESVEHLYLTVDLDGFPSYLSPGVSAPGVVGLDTATVMQAIRSLTADGNVLGFDLAECNPRFDIDDRTARLGARLAVTFLEALSLAKLDS